MADLFLATILVYAWSIPGLWDEWVFIGLLVAMMAAAIYNLPRVWRGELDTERFAVFWPWARYSAAIQRGFVRAVPAAIIVVVVASAAIPLAWLVPEEPQGPFARPYWVMLPYLAAFIGSLALMGSVVFFNRPKFLVPPYLRDRPGALAEWIAGWRRTRRLRRERLSEGRPAGARPPRPELDYPLDVSLDAPSREAERTYYRRIAGIEAERDPSAGDAAERGHDQEGWPPASVERRSGISQGRAR